MQVFVVLKNADFTEGRGPMLFHKVFATKKAAHDYIMDQEGIYGSKQGVSSYGYNGYNIREVDVIESYDAGSKKIANEEYEKALQNLKAAEKNLNKYR